MLEINNERKHHYRLPHLLIPHRKQSVYVTMPVSGQDIQTEEYDQIERLATIEQEMNENSIELNSNFDPDRLADSWSTIVDDLRKDPDWTDFSNES